MGKWLVMTEPNSGRIGMHREHRPYQPCWLTPQEAQELSEDLIGAVAHLAHLEHFDQNTQQGLADAAAGRWVEDKDLDAFVQKVLE